MKIEIKRTSLMCSLCFLVHFTSKTINIKINHGPFYGFKTEIMRQIRLIFGYDYEERPTWYQLSQ